MEELEGAVAVGAERRPVTIGLHTSACSCELLELYLHKEGKIPIGKVIKHDWFKRPLPEQKAEPLVDRKMPVDFPGKKELYELMYIIEEQRNTLIYGRATAGQVDIVLRAFNQLKTLLMEKVGGQDE